MEKPCETFYSNEAVCCVVLGRRYFLSMKKWGVRRNLSVTYMFIN